jgi:predicted metal-binding membrane protein
MLSTSVMTAWREGSRLGVECALSCSAPMAALLVAGLMNVPMMAVVTAAITGERVPTSGARIARLTGAIALVAGSIICGRAIGASAIVP